MELTDECKMPFGKHAGKKMEDVPADYLLWLYDELNADHSKSRFNDREGKWVRIYIRENLDVLHHEIKKARTEEEEPEY